MVLPWRISYPNHVGKRNIPIDLLNSSSLNVSKSLVIKHKRRTVRALVNSRISFLNDFEFLKNKK